MPEPAPKVLTRLAAAADELVVEAVELAILVVMELLYFNYQDIGVGGEN